MSEIVTESAPSRLENFPVSLFGVTMGIFGLALAGHAGGFPAVAAGARWTAAGLLALFLGLYAARAVRYPAAMRADWSHPVRLAFLPATSISVLLLATSLRDAAPVAAEALWVAGAAVQGVLTIAIVSVWIGHRAFGPGQLSPAWFIPAVGNVVVPVAGIPLGHVEASWYFFSVGMLFWIVLLALVFNRLIFHDPLPLRLRPTLVILIAPPALGFLVWTAFHGGEVDGVARIFLNLAYFFTALVAVQVPALLRQPFALSFWALSFPLAAVATASFRFADLTGSAAHGAAGLVLFAALIVTVAALTVRTLRAAAAGEICRPE